MKREEGFALVLALLIATVVAILVFGATFTSLADRMGSSNQLGASAAYSLALAGMQKYKTLAFTTFRHYLDHLEDYADELSGADAMCSNLFAIGLEGAGLKLGRWTAQESPIGDANQSYRVRLERADPYLVIISEGAAGRARATVSLIVQGEDAGLWRHGLVTSRLRGSARVFGSAHLTGQPGSNAVAAGMRMHNHYTHNDLQALVGGSVEALRLSASEARDLCARLRVKGGWVNLMGTSRLGDASAPAGFKAALAGVHVGADGNMTGTIHADAVGSYDLAPEVSVPVLDADGEGRTYCDHPGPTWRECLREMARLVLTEDAVSFPGGAFSPECNLTGVLDAQSLTFGEIPITCVDNPMAPTQGFRYSLQGGEWTLETYGVVNLRGLDLRFETDVRYAGNATLFVERVGGQGGDVTISSNLLAKNSFPGSDALGIIVEGTLEASGAVAGLFYAGARAVVGGTVFGGLVAGEFCTSGDCEGSAEANIVAVPGLAYALPPGFAVVPDSHVATFRTVSFERRGRYGE